MFLLSEKTSKYTEFWKNLLEARLNRTESKKKLQYWNEAQVRFEEKSEALEPERLNCLSTITMQLKLNREQKKSIREVSLKVGSVWICSRVTAPLRPDCQNPNTSFFQFPLNTWEKLMHFKKLNFPEPFGKAWGLNTNYSKNFAKARQESGWCWWKSR